MHGNPQTSRIECPQTFKNPVRFAQAILGENKATFEPTGSGVYTEPVHRLHKVQIDGSTVEDVDEYNACRNARWFVSWHCPGDKTVVRRNLVDEQKSYSIADAYLVTTSTCLWSSLQYPPN